MKISKAEYTDIGCRRINEDAFCSEIGNGQWVYAAVADGLGGHGNGDVASQIAVSHLSKCGACRSLPNEALIEQWFQEANQEIIEKNQSAEGMRTTAVFLSVFENRAIWAHVGDSRLYHFYEGQLKHFTLDHSVPQSQVFAGELTREQIPFSPDRNKLYRSIGEQYLEIEIHPEIQLQSGKHAFLLCSDGFWEYLQEREIGMDLVKSNSPEEWLTYLRCRGALRKTDYSDNHTAITLFVEI